LAGREDGRVRVLHRIVRRRARAADLDAVVDHAVAVVVQAGADFHHAGDVAVAVEDAVLAGVHARLALAHVAAAGAADGREAALVDLTVAVVVDAVAHLGHRAVASLADPSGRSGARERAGAARRRERAGAVARAAHRRAPAQVLERAAVAREGPAAVHAL